MKKFLPLSPGALLLLLCALLFCTACASSKKKKVEPPAHRVVGTIVTVNEQNHFVLIDAGTNFPADKGVALKTFSNGKETGVLSVGEQRKPPFVIADIASGSPQKGDQVMQ